MHRPPLRRLLRDPRGPALGLIALLVPLAMLTPLSPLLMIAGCAPTARYEKGVFRAGPVAFRVGALGGEWQRARVEGGGVAFHHRSGGTIFAGVDCKESEDVPLDVLTNHLLFGIEERREVSRDRMTLDGRAALRTRVDGTLDGVPVTLDLVVLKKNGCTCDLHLVAGAAAYAERRPDFDRFLGGFAKDKGD